MVRISYRGMELNTQCICIKMIIALQLVLYEAHVSVVDKNVIK